MILIPPAGAALPNAYYLGKYEVTQGEWKNVMGYNPSGSQAGMDWKIFPVQCVSWFDSVEFCNKLSKREGLKPYYELTVTKRQGPATGGPRRTAAGHTDRRSDPRPRCRSDCAASPASSRKWYTPLGVSSMGRPHYRASTMKCKRLQDAILRFASRAKLQALILAMATSGTRSPTTSSGLASASFRKSPN